MADQLTFYTNPMSRGRIIRWMLEEVGQPYETVILGYGTSMKGPEYLAINPMGKVPAIKHGNAVVTEGAAICAYLADVFPQAGLAPANNEERARYYRWMFFAAGPIEAAANAKSMGWTATEDKERMLGFGSMKHVLDALEFALKDTPYIAGDRFTAADVYFGSHIMWGVQRRTTKPTTAAGLTPMKDLFSLKGRVALVTGGSRGIGKMIAEGFLHQGAKVYISARKGGALEEAATELSAIGPCIPLVVDAAGADGAQKMADAFLGHEDTLDILVNNAGAAWGAAFDEFPENGWDKVMDLNVKTPFFLTQKLHEALKRGAAKGHLAKVINIASIDGISVNPQETYSYAASKAGLIHLTKRMALRLIQDNISVTAIAPGAFASDMNRVARDHGDMVSQAIPSKRIGTPEDMAGAAIFLASRAGDYVVGSTLVVDGGVSYARG
jgi:NAD(P)-dependent dehydrogenase (short-subunit alcohol dehydrogenase family)/glutathione S-transferase